MSKPKKRSPSAPPAPEDRGPPSAAELKKLDNETNLCRSLRGAIDSLRGCRRAAARLLIDARAAGPDAHPFAEAARDVFLDLAEPLAVIEGGCPPLVLLLPGDMEE